MSCRITLLAVVASAVACSSHKAPGPPTFTLSVDDAELERGIGGAQAPGGDVFVEVGVTLTNVSEATPLPAQFSLYSLTTAAFIVYQPHAISTTLTPACGNVAVAAGGHLSCRLAFELPMSEVPAQIDYSDATGNRKTTATIPDPSALPPLPPPQCTVPGAACMAGSDCCSGVCDPNSKTCTLLSGACTPSGSPCTSPFQCCSNYCGGQVCAAAICLPTGATCGGNTAVCCGFNCVTAPPPDGSHCQGAPSSCGTLGEKCRIDADCCSRTCTGARCGKDASACNMNGDVCFANADCCSSVCNFGIVPPLCWP